MQTTADSRTLRRCLDTLYKRARWCAILLSCSGCVYFPQVNQPDATFTKPPVPESRLNRALGKYCGTNQRNSFAWTCPRVTLIEDPHQALTTRLDLIDAADQSLDLQYFIWQNDPTGILTIDKILSAADRGVRVRVLLDDVQLEGLVTRLNAFNEHPNIEIRIFNPFSFRWRYRLGVLRMAEFVLDGNRLNHRMHNKLLVADNQVAMLGGRNIGDDYFGRGLKRNFLDMDILLSEPVVLRLSDGFDTYWNSRWSFPIDTLINLSIIPDDLSRLRKRIRERLLEHPDLERLRRSRDYDDTIRLLYNGNTLLKSEMLIDDPSVRWFDNPDELADRLTDIAASTQQEALIVTPYLIPTKKMLSLAQTMMDNGVRIKVVTNSLETNDVVLAQAAYARHRRDILNAGIELYELRGDSIFVGTGPAREIALHQKYMLLDGQYVFVSSLNLDPRSLHLNTELGLLLESPEFAQETEASFYRLTRPENSWRLTLEDDKLVWRSAAGTHYRSPAKSIWQWLRYSFYKLLPLSKQL